MIMADIPVVEENCWTRAWSALLGGFGLLAP